MARVLILNDSAWWHCGSAAVTAELRSWFSGHDVTTIPTPKPGTDFGTITESAKGFDLVVLNGEGTLHHDSPVALAWLGVIRAVAGMGIPTAVVNASWYEMRRPEALEALRAARLVSVREIRSARHLAGRDLDVYLHPDLSTAYLVPRISPTLRKPLSTYRLGRYWQGRRGGTVSAAGMEFPSYLSHDPTSPAEVPRSSDPRAFVDFAAGLASGDAVLYTGEFHAYCAAVAVAAPVVAFPGNTPKIEGMAEMLGVPLPWIADGDQATAVGVADAIAGQARRALVNRLGVVDIVRSRLLEML
jgi:hypothetical protein